MGMPRNELTWFGGAFAASHHPISPISAPVPRSAVCYLFNGVSARPASAPGVARTGLHDSQATDRPFTVQLKWCRKKKHLPGSPGESLPQRRQIGRAAAAVQSGGGDPDEPQEEAPVFPVSTYEPYMF